MNTNHSLPTRLERAETALRDLPQELGPSAATLERIANLATSATTFPVPETRTPSKRGVWRRVVTLLLTSAAVVAVVYGLTQAPGTTFAFEDVVTAVRNADTVSYTTVLTQKDGRESQHKTFHKGTLSRTEFADGSYSVTDFAGQKLVMLHPATKTANVTLLGGKPLPVPMMKDSILNWLKSAEATGKPLGEKTIDGVRTLGFEAAFGPTTMTIWGDPKTNLPVQIDSLIGAPSEAIPMVMKDFVFNAALSDELFSTEVPAGYQVRETQQLAVDYSQLVKLPPEEHVVRILRFYSHLSDGTFPERIDGPELVSKMVSLAGAKKMEDPEFKKEFTTLAASMGTTWTFRQTLDKFGYQGTARLNDPDKIVFWYLPKNAEKYRVVFADLTTGDVTADRLPVK